ncbi:type II toxin-antitoxin system antitoxin SocA domain-containing protein [Chitinophaga sp. RAB17]|uniref:type II toxin-antitoxin system antitoxin SocA domain-containing protein n=1 Tax=Chitinophaga sp. RAB17 TaxID=3233049 RepID=UPI003F8F66CF
MKSPFTGGKVELKTEVRKLEYRKEKFPIHFHFYKCIDSGEEFTDTALDNLNVAQIHNKYRSKFGIPFVEEIKEIREQYGLSAAKMSEVLGLGINVYRQYEGGEIPSVATGRLIRLAKDPGEFRKLLEISQGVFESHEYDRVLRKINQAAQADTIDEKLYFYLFESKYPNMLNGFRMPDIKRIAGMIHFFAQENKPYTTALNKLLFYADFVHFKKHGTGISGMCYKAFEKGPVPNNYGSVYNYLLNKGLINMTEVTFQDFVGDQFYSERNIQLNEEGESLFSATEIAVLKSVSKRFKGKTTKEIVQISHLESAWQNNADMSGRITYEYSFDLKVTEK